MRKVCLILLSFLLSACGQTGPLYMPGAATGVHKKDQFILGNSQPSSTASSSSTNKNAPKVAPKTPKPAVESTQSQPVVDTADDSTASDEDSTPLDTQDTLPPGTVQ